MLCITVPGRELYDERTNEFKQTKDQVLQLEHSLVSISKWESKWHKPFLAGDKKNLEETRDYVRCMTLTQNVSPDVYKCLTRNNIKEINEYIDDPMTATWFRKSEGEGRPGRKETITSEVIYYQMIALDIPFECQKWHLNRLLTLIRVCAIKNTPAKKMSKHDVMKQNTALNAARKAKMGARG